MKPIIQGPRYLPSSTPQNVVINLQRAYSTRDSTGYDSLFDAAYVGTTIDLFATGPDSLMTFSKADEALHISALARATTITGITVQYPPTLLRERDGADPPGWATVPVNGARIEIDDNPASLITSPSEAMQFKMAPTTPSAGSPTDTTWHIVRWTELRLYM